MTAKENRHYRSLELDKILEKLSEFTASDEAGERALEIMPCHTLDGAQTLIDQTVDAHMLLAKFGGPSFGGLVNVNNSLSRAEAGGTLTMGELLKIAEGFHLPHDSSASDNHEIYKGSSLVTLDPHKLLKPTEHLRIRKNPKIVTPNRIPLNRRSSSN